MRVYVNSPSHLSRAMFRVDKALVKYLPPNAAVVERLALADLVVIPVIGYPDAVGAVQDCIDRGQDFAMIQYCVRTTQEPHTRKWLPLWKQAKCVWSYYNLNQMIRDDNPDMTEEERHIPSFYAPLGVDEVFAGHRSGYAPRTIGAVTTGYVSGSSAEAIEEVAIAAGKLGKRVSHIGPFPVGMSTESPGSHWQFHFAISDEELLHIYERTEWVSGLRHGEGFELPVLEGLCCGARPILFDRPEMHYWYDGHAVFVPECSGEELVAHLVRIMSTPPEPVSFDERRRIIRRFDWASIAADFWSYTFQSVGQ